ncbi:MAG: alpha/beta hydrolase [Bacteroidia bacterium]|nr:alpha/beta hydrolase [Bacteroidia bacterium]
MKIYAIPGLGADARLYAHLTLEHDLEVVEWLMPEGDEDFSGYMQRMSETIDQSKPFALLGVSFGGLAVVELSRIVSPAYLILVSSIDSRDDMPVLYKALGAIRLGNVLPEFLFKLPKRLTAWLFGTTNTAELYPILNDMKPKLVKWSMKQIAGWTNTKRPENCFKICGSQDRLFPPKNCENGYVLEGGAHFMVVDRAGEISDIINQHLAHR